MNSLLGRFRRGACPSSFALDLQSEGFVFKFSSLPIDGFSSGVSSVAPNSTPVRFVTSSHLID